MVLDNHEFSTPHWWPFVVDNTINFRPVHQIKDRAGRRCGFTNVISVSVKLQQL